MESKNPDAARQNSTARPFPAAILPRPYPPAQIRAKRKLLFLPGVSYSMSKLTLALLSVALLPQQPAPDLPVYDAVTIKLNNTLANGARFNTYDASFQGTNVPFKNLLVIAFEIRAGLIFGLPGWANSARFDINAKVTDPDLKVMHSLSRTQRHAMLAAILSDRFHLRSHIEIKTLPVYEMVIANGGPKLTPSAPLPPDAARFTPGAMDINNNDMSATGATLVELAENLSFPLDRTVINKTGLNGRYDFHLHWSPENAPSTDNPDAPPGLLTALQEQLGLKLQPAKGPVPTLVIDHVEQPAGN